jgi:hypothetical protein
MIYAETNSQIRILIIFFTVGLFICHSPGFSADLERAYLFWKAISTLRR